MAAFPARGGLLSLELGLAAEVPLRLRTRPVPPPAPPGRTYGDLGDEALRLARFIVREHLALRREGRLAGPELTWRWKNNLQAQAGIDLPVSIENNGFQLVQDYRIIYVIQPTTLYIVTVVHGARDLTRMQPAPWEG